MRFNPRICKRCDRWQLAKTNDFTSVSIHASVKDATTVFCHPIHIHLVSIHASVKDATDHLSKRNGGRTVSIHASVKDATKASIYWARRSHGFNPRICKRCDIGREHLKKQIIVSIHASVKDATVSSVVTIKSLKFQSTHL